MRGVTKESPTTAARRRLRFVRCPVCTKAMKTQKLADHMKKQHRMPPVKSDSEALLMVCPEHEPFAYVNIRKTPQRQIKAFVNAHKDHLQASRKLKRAERNQLDALFDKEFGEGAMDPDLVEIFDVSSDEEVPQIPRQKQVQKKKKKDYNVDLDASPIPGPSWVDPEEITTAVKEILPSETTKSPDEGSDINTLKESIPQLVPLDAIQSMLFTDPLQPTAMQQEYVTTFIPGLANPTTLDIGVGTNLVTTTDAAVNTLASPTTLDMGVGTTPLTTTDAAVNTTPPTLQASTATETTPRDEDGPILENSYAYIRSMNDMKNQMIRQLLQDNIAMAQAKQNSRIRALQHLDEMLHLQEQDNERDNPYDVDTMDMYNDIFKLKERFIHQLLAENVQAHPQHYHLYELLKNLQ